MKTLKQLNEAIYTAKAAYHDAIEKRFRPGMDVTVMHGVRRTPAKVDAYVGYDRVRVRSSTGKTYVHRRVSAVGVRRTLKGA